MPLYCRFYNKKKSLFHPFSEKQATVDLILSIFLLLFALFLPFLWNIYDIRLFIVRYFFFSHHIGGVMVSSLASSVVDRGLDPRSGQTIDYIKLVYVAFPLSTQHEGEITKNGWLGIRIM